MSIRFKFRSAVNFDTVEIEDRGSISVRELRARILRIKHLQQQQQGFDLVLSDAVSGLEFKSDDYQIPSGSSVIVKRVPCGTVPSALSPIEARKDVGVKESSALTPHNEPMDEFDDFGADLCPILDPKLPHSDQEIKKNSVMPDRMEGFTGLRLEARNLHPNNLNQDIPKGCNQPGNKKNHMLESRVEEQRKISKLSASNFLAVQNTNLPLEMKCSLCNTFFKEAVMIPCCQHSFCEKCIRGVLVEKGKCPKCLSCQCSVEDLLPNLSLRQAIEHFLESNIVDDVLENHDMKKYVPDGESGIQVRDTSCALTVVQREPEMPQSSCATGKGSNQIFESYNEQHRKRTVPFADSADSSAKRKAGFWIDNRGVDRNFQALGGHRKGVRNCYSCGSPDHLMRDCPTFNPNPMFQPGNEAFNGNMPGYAPSYWESSSLPHFRPFSHMYSNHAMMPFNASLVPMSHFAMPPYMPSMCGGLPGSGGNMGMGNMGPPGHSEFFQLQHCENRRKHSNENPQREQLSDNRAGSPEGYRHYNPQKPQEYILQHREKERSFSHSEDSFARRSGKESLHDKHLDFDARYAGERHEKSSHSSLAGREKRQHPVERSNSSTGDMPRSSDRYSEGRHKHHYGDSKKYHERTGHSELSHHSTQRGLKRRAEHDIRDSHKKHHSHSESVFEPSSPTARKRGYIERDTEHDSRHSRHSSKHASDKHRDDKCKIIDSSDKDHRDEHCYHHRKRVY